MNTSNCTEDAPNFDMETMMKVMDSFKNLPPPLVGIACSPYMKAQIDCAPEPPAMQPLAAAGFGVPFIVDPRMMSDKAEAYYDREAWLKRCKEQREYDASIAA